MIKMNLRLSLRKKLLYKGYGLLDKIGLIRLMRVGASNGSIVVLHRVNDYDKSELTTSSKVFHDMLNELSMNWHVVPLRTLVKRIRQGTPIASRMVAITFDDGYKDNREVAAPILDKFGFPATFFVTSGYIGTNRTFPWDRNDSSRPELMSWNDVRELAALGHEIGAHTVNHADLGQVPLVVAREEIIQSKARIEAAISRPVHSFAFPYGKSRNIRKDAVDIIKDAGFECCCTAYGGKVRHTTDPFNLHRIPIYPNVIELQMELQNFMTYYDESMHIHLPGGVYRLAARGEERKS